MKTNTIKIIIGLLLVTVVPIEGALGQTKRRVPVKSVNTKKKTVSQKPKSLEQLLAELNQNMVFVEGGTFMMGANYDDDSEVRTEETPAHPVSLSSYYICKYEVTQELWTAVKGTNPSHFKGSMLPVESIKWEECQDFINRLNSLSGQNYRFLTEAEWEYAARGGKMSKGYKYSGSNVLKDVAWYDDNSGNKTHNVGSKRPNELGIYDMSGNVGEWCQDWYASYDESTKTKTNPQGPSRGRIHVYRGGDYWFPSKFGRVSSRHCPAVTDSYGIGLRLAK